MRILADVNVPEEYAAALRGDGHDVTYSRSVEALGPEATDDGSGRRVDEATLQYLAGVLAGQPEVSGTSLFPENREETLVVSMDDRYYPDPIGSVSLEIRRSTNGEFHVSYVESYLEAIRQCRWDRHEQDHSTRDHWHPLPSASTADAEDRAFPPGLLATIETVVLPWLEERLGTLWNETR